MSAVYSARLALALGMCLAFAGPPVPGSGTKIAAVCDDFEDESWEYIPNNPKASAEIDGNSRPPMGYSKNRLWLEGPGRGHPDLIKRVDTPAGGLPGSTGALQIATFHGGVPNRKAKEAEQDDLFLNITAKLGYALSPSSQPSVVVRVFVPPVETWQQRDGSHFALRTSALGTRRKPSKGAWGRTTVQTVTEGYWPGIFFQLYDDKSRADKTDHPYLLIRSGPMGEDYYKMPVKETGWWTLGMSFTGDGQVHYFASPGVDDLTPADHLASHFPYGFRCQQINEVFFDIWNDSRSGEWSPSWIIDDLTICTGSGAAIARGPRRAR